LTDKKQEVKNNKYITLVWKLNPPRFSGIYGGSTPKIALDLAKFAIELNEKNWQRFDMLERYKIYNEKCLKERLKKRSVNT
jgi:hypothetical protein